MYLNSYYKEEYSKLLKSDYLNDLSNYADLDSERLYRYGREAYDQQDFETSKKCEILNKIINNCVISSSCYIGSGTKIAYGGVGVLIHPQTKIGKNCMIGTNVTIGAAPIIGDYVYISTGVRLVGVGIDIGSFSIIGANAVVVNDVPPFSIVAGMPAKVIKRITPDNVDRYLESYFAVVDKKNIDFVNKVRQRFFSSYKQYLMKNQKEEQVELKKVSDKFDLSGEPHLEQLMLENKNLMKKNEELERTIETKNKEILSRLESEEDTLKKLKELIHENNRLQARYYNILKKYDLLSNAKLGKLTLKYWKFKKRIPNDF